MKKGILISIIFTVIFFSALVIAEDFSGKFNINVTLDNGQKITVPNTTKELFLENIEGNSAVFYFENEKKTLSFGESTSFGEIKISIIELTSNKVVFNVIGLIMPIGIAIETTPLTAELVSDKIVTHAVALINIYVNDLPAPTSVFPNGTFSFLLNNGYVIGFSPQFIDGKVFRGVEFDAPDNTVHVIILDGPVSDNPGNIKPELMAQAKQELENHLSNSNMMVNRVFKEDARINLSYIPDFENFTQRIYNSIKVSKLPSTDPEPISVILPKGTYVKIDSDKNIININNTTNSSVRVINTKIDINKKEMEIKINTNKESKKLSLEINDQIFSTTDTIELKDSKLYLDTSEGRKEIKVLPLKIDQEVILTQEKAIPLYILETENEARIIAIFPIIIEIETKVSAETGATISVKKPWWAFLATESSE